MGELQPDGSHHLLPHDERYRTVFALAPDIIFELSAPDGAFTDLSPSFENIVGWPVSGWIGKPFASILHAADLPLAEEIFGMILHRLLTDACFTNSRLAMEKERVDLSVLVERVVREMQKTATKHAIAVRMSGALEVTIDPLYIEQVVANLLDNAIRYNPNGGSIEVAVSSPSSGDIHVSVCDHGIGISPDQRTHLFDRFHRAHSESYQSGFGIGLYISRQIVELHGGTISAQFPPDGGTCFVVTLPRDRAENRP